MQDIRTSEEEIKTSIFTSKNNKKIKSTIGRDNVLCQEKTGENRSQNLVNNSQPEIDSMTRKLTKAMLKAPTNVHIKTSLLAIA